MNVQMRATLSALLAAGSIFAFSSVPAAAQTTGSESSDGMLVVSSASGTRDVLSSVIRLSGVFNGVGRIVEVPNLATDPDNVSRDDLVFAEGTLHLVNTNLSFSFTPDLRSCTATFQVQQTNIFDGGTGMFAGVSGSGVGTVTARGLARRNPDGSCAFDQLPLHEIDTVSGSGTMSF